MNVLTNLVKQNLILNKRRTIVTIISIILSASLICGVATLVASFQKFLIDVTIETEGEHHAIIKDVDNDDIKFISENALIEKINTKINLGFAISERLKSEYTPYLEVTAYSSNELKTIELLEGKLPTNSNEIIISEYANKEGKAKYKVGEEISLHIGTRFVDNKKVTDSSYVNYEENGIIVKENLVTTREIQTYKIVGIIKETMNNYYSAGFKTLTISDETLKNEYKISDVYVVMKNPKNIYEKLEKITASLDIEKENIKYHTELLRMYGVTNNNEANNILYTFALILIGVIMIASIVVIYNSFNISIVERKKQFGILSSIGTTGKQIRSMVLKEGLILGLISIPLGIIFGILGIYLTLIFINSLDIFGSFMKTELTLSIIPLSIYVTIFFGFLTILISSLIPAIKASRTSPIDAIRLKNDIKIKGKKLKVGFLSKKLFGIEGELAVKNVKRNRKKYRSTIISLFVSIVLFMSINAFAEYSLRSAKKIYNNFNFNIYVQGDEDDINKIAKLKNIGEYTISKQLFYESYLDETDINPKIKASMKKSNYNNETKKYYIGINLSTLGNDEYNRYLKKNNLTKEEAKNKVILIKNSNYYDMAASKFYQLKMTNHKVGDTIELVNGEIKNKIEIAKISEIYPIGFNEADSYSMNIQGFISEEMYLELTKENDENSISSPYMMINSSDSDKTFEEIKTFIKNNDMTLEIQNINEYIRMLNNIILAVSIFLYGFIILVTLITVTNIINTITTSIYLRRREFATLKAVGMTNKDFNKMIRFESMFYGLKALLFGLPVGIFLDYTMYKNLSGVFVYDYLLPFKPVLICVVFVFVIIFITMIYSINKLKNDNIIDVIKQENI